MNVQIVRHRSLFIPLAVIGIAMISLAQSLFGEIRDHTKEMTYQRLDAIAGIQSARTSKVIQGFFDMSEIVTSRPRNTERLFQYQTQPNPELLDEIKDFLDVIMDLPGGYEAIILHDAQGNIIAETPKSYLYDNLLEGGDYLYEQENIKRLGEHQLVGIEYNSLTNSLNVYMRGPIFQEGVYIGSADIIIDAQGLMDITQNRRGLLGTEEVIITQTSKAGDAISLMPLRFWSNASISSYSEGDIDGVSVIGAPGGHGGHTRYDDIDDYRSEPVLAVSRYIDSQHWGLIVKIDQQEAYRDLDNMRQRFIYVLSGCFLLFLLLIYLSERQPIQETKSRFPSFFR